MSWIALKVLDFFEKDRFPSNCSQGHIEWSSEKPVGNFLTEDQRCLAGGPKNSRKNCLQCSSSNFSLGTRRTSPTGFWQFSTKTFVEIPELTKKLLVSKVSFPSRSSDGHVEISAVNLPEILPWKVEIIRLTFWKCWKKYRVSRKN